MWVSPNTKQKIFSMYTLPSFGSICSFVGARYDEHQYRKMFCFLKKYFQKKNNYRINYFLKLCTLLSHFGEKRSTPRRDWWVVVDFDNHNKWLGPIHCDWITSKDQAGAWSRALQWGDRQAITACNKKVQVRTACGAVRCRQHLRAHSKSTAIHQSRLGVLACSPKSDSKIHFANQRSTQCTSPISKLCTRKCLYVWSHIYDH